MRKIIAVCFSAIMLTLAVGMNASAGSDEFVCDPQQSFLCAGLVDIWQANGSNDSFTYGRFGRTLLLEKDNTDIIRSAAQTKIGSYSYLFDGADAFVIPKAGWGAGNWTICAWIYPTNTTVDRYILYSNDDGYGGTVFALDASAGDELTSTVYSVRNDNPFTITPGGTSYDVTDNQWTLVCASHKGYGVESGISHKLGVAKNNAGPTWSAVITEPISSGTGDLLLFHNFVGYVGQIGIWNRSFKNSDLLLLWNSGSGVSFTSFH
jgi:hypothetical protein